MSTERKQIAFVTNPTAKSPLAAPAASGEKKSYENHTFKPEYSDLKLKFEQALTWLRFIPSIRGSAQCWLMPVDVFASDNNDTNQFPTFVDPKSVDPNAVSVFEQARMWFYKNEKEVLRKKDENPRGFKLHPRKRCIAWAMVNGAESGKTLRIFEASLYDGKFGGATGLGHSPGFGGDPHDPDQQAGQDGRHDFPCGLRCCICFHTLSLWVPFRSESRFSRCFLKKSFLSPAGILARFLLTAGGTKCRSVTKCHPQKAYPFQPDRFRGRWIGREPEPRAAPQQEPTAVF